MKALKTPLPVSTAGGRSAKRLRLLRLHGRFILALSCVAVLIFAGLVSVKAAPVTATVPPAGNAATGRALFSGATPLLNGGPACLACHTVAGAGALGGGSVGPDLTAVYTRYGQAGLADALAKPLFPTMQPLFRGHPLTPAEQADLVAYLRQVAQRYPSTTPSRLTYNHRSLATVEIAFLAIVGAGVLLLAANAVWRDRLIGVRRSLLERR